VPLAYSVLHALPARITRSPQPTPPATHAGPRRPNVTSIEKRGRHQDEAAECDEGDATPDLLLKHPNKTFTTYVQKQLKHL
jgi:hypothetical protein